MNANIRTHNGEVTIENPETGGYRTFSIRTQGEDSRFAPGRRVVALLAGPDNTSDYQGFGFADASGIKVWGKKAAKKSFCTFADMLENPSKWESKGAVYHFSTKCRVCNRKLTPPESVTSGIGPICSGR